MTANKLVGIGARRAEYVGRLQRVMDHVEANLERDLTLEELARVACFSPFHFHRVFTALTGETLYQFILRLRLERAASQLLQNRGKSVTAVALDNGFGSSATFARAFRSAFGMSATEWRAGGSKKRNMIGKEGKDRKGSGTYGDPTLVAGATSGQGPIALVRNAMSKKEVQPVKEALSVKVENLPPMTVAYVRHVGPYAGNTALFGRLFGRLMQWAGPRGLIRGPESTKLLTVYHDNPDITPEVKLRISVCITVPPGTPVDGEIGSMELPGGQYVMAHFELDPSEYGAAWNWLFSKWFPESGYQPDERPCFEIYLNDPKQHPQGRHVVDICEPVRPM